MPLVGRDEELRQVGEVAGFAGTAGIALIEGEAGIGKTSLWRAGLAAAREAGASVRATVAVESEARFAYSKLADLIGGHSGVFDELAPVPRSALERALLLGGPAEGDVQLHAVSVGFASALTLLSESSRLVIAVDDEQWLDPASAAVLSFAARRARAERVRFLFTRRSGLESTMRDGLSQARVIRLEALSFGALQHLLVSHGFALSAFVTRRIHERSGGNPFFALEMAAALARRGHALEGLDDVLVPETLLGLLDLRVAGVSAEGERAVLVAALAGDPPPEIVIAIAGDAGLDAAEQAGLLIRGDGKVHLAHPLIGTAVRARAGARDLREAHGALATARLSDEERARHLALASDAPDEHVAATLERAGADADARAATAAAAELAREAVRFTPLNDPARRRRRILVAADALMRAGRLIEGRELLEPELPSFPPGQERVQARFHFLRLSRQDQELSEWEKAVAEAEGHLRSQILSEMSFSATAGAVARLGEARQWAEEALALAQVEEDTQLEASARQSLGFAAALQADLQPARELAGIDLPLPNTLNNARERLFAMIAIWRGEVEQAEQLLDELTELAESRGEEWASAAMLMHRFELETRIGDRVRIEATIEAFRRVTAPLGPLVEETLPRMCAFAAAFAGDVEGARRHADFDGGGWQRLDARRACALAALFTGDPESAAHDFLAIDAHLVAAGVREPGVFPIAGGAAEALIALGRLDEARPLAERLAEAERSLDHPWAAVVGARVEGLLTAADGDVARAESAYGRALARHATLRLSLDEARTKLAYGSLLRRERRLGEARSLLEDAAARFDELGATPLAERARGEVARIPGRRAAGGLTAAEEQVAALVAQGLTNREVAAALVVTPKVVERHLTRVYAKLGLRTRADLARRVAESGGISRLVQTQADP